MVQEFKTNQLLKAGLIVGLVAIFLSLIAFSSILLGQSNTITLNQLNQNTVQATSSGTTNGWNWTVVSSQPSGCHNLTYSSTNADPSSTNSKIINLSSGRYRDGNYICVRAGQLNSSDYDYSNPLRLDMAGPTIVRDNPTEIGKINLTIRDQGQLHADTSNDTSFNQDSLVGSSGVIYGLLDNSSACQASNSSHINLTTNLAYKTVAGSTGDIKAMVVIITTESAWHNKYLCLKAVDKIGNHTYKSVGTVDLTAPTTKFSHNPSAKTVTATISEAVSIKVAAKDGSACSLNASDVSSPIRTATRTSRITVNYTKGANNVDNPLADGTVRSLCFEIKDNHLNSLYLDYTIDNSPPSGSVYQSNRLVWMAATDTDLRAADNRNNSGDLTGVLPNDWSIKSFRSKYVNVTTTTAGDNEAVVSAVTAACSSTNFSRNSGTGTDYSWTTYSTGSSHGHVWLNSNHTYEGVCFKATDKVNLSGYGSIVLKTLTSSSNPKIEFSRTTYGPEINLSVDRGTVASWRSKAVSDPNTATCASAADLTGGQGPTSTAKIQIASTAVGKSYCVEALWTNPTDRTESLVYQLVPVSSEPIDQTGPTITTTQAGWRLTATATDDLVGVDQNSWSWAELSSLDENTNRCRANPLNNNSIPNNSWRSGRIANLSTRNSDRWVCFRVSDSVGNTAYQPVTATVPTTTTPAPAPDRTAPSVNVSQNGNQVTATSRATDLPANPNWRYQTGSSSTCNSSRFTSSSPGTPGRSLDVSSRHNQWICFSVTDTSNNTGYGNIRVNLNRPRVSISQTGNQVTARADKTIIAWEAYKSTTSPSSSCRDQTSNWNPNRRSVVSSNVITNLTPAESGHWVCFRAQDSNSNWGHGYRQIATIKAPTIPKITISFIKTTAGIVAQANHPVDQWHYLLYPGQPTDCNQSNQYFSNQNLVRTGSTINLNNDSRIKYICVRATGTIANQVSYASHRVGSITKITPTPITDIPPVTPKDDTQKPTEPTEPTPPAITIKTSFDSQTNMVVASTEATIISWHHLLFGSQPDCESREIKAHFSGPSVGAGNKVSLNNPAVKYICFRAIASNAQTAYHRHAVVDRPHVPVAPTPTEPDPADPEPDPVPSLKLTASRDGDIVSATANQEVEWVYLIYGQTADCSSNNKYFSSQRVASGNTVDLSRQPAEVRFICFEATNQAGTKAYIDYEIETPIKTVPVPEPDPDPDQTDPAQPTTPAQQTPPTTRTPTPPTTRVPDQPTTPEPSTPDQPTTTDPGTGQPEPGKDSEPKDPKDPKDTDDDIPWHWIGGGIILAIVLVTILFQIFSDSSKEEMTETTADDPDDDDSPF